MKETELLPCPFCGDTPRVSCINKGKPDMYFTVHCDNSFCGVGPTTKKMKQRGTAVNVWNWRAVIKEDGKIDPVKC